MDSQGRQQPLLGQDQIIKPGQVPNLGFLNPAQKQQAQTAVSRLWQRMHASPPDSAEHQQAHLELSNMSHSFKIRLQAFKQQQAQQQAQQQQQQALLREQQQQQLGQQDAQAQAQMQRSASQAMAMQQQQQQQRPQATQMQYSEKVKAEVQKFLPAVPQELRNNSSEDQKKWVTSTRIAYANLMSRWENESRAYEAFRTRASQNRPNMSDADFESAKGQMMNLKAKLDAAQKAAMAYKIQHDPNAAEQFRAQQQARAAQANQAQAQNNINQQSIKPEVSGNGQAQIKREEQDNQNEVNGQDNQTSQTQPIRPPAAPVQVQPQNAVPAGQPQPLTHQAALASAQRSYSQPVVQTQTNQNQPLQRETATPSSSINASIGKLNNRPIEVKPLSAVTMPAARPTLTGGQGPQGQMGQAALQKTPGYNAPVEGEGHVLSRNKLRELAREVTGGAAGDDALDPDVEEILLEVVDEFVDSVTAQACMLAKARGSDTLDLRDVQVVIERNYNIRVPGYGSDELRTVKRIVPSPAWTQKMSAVQAAKLSNGKNEA